MKVNPVKKFLDPPLPLSDAQDRRNSLLYQAPHRHQLLQQLNGIIFLLSDQFYRGVKSVFSFLAEQPSQLKYIEWPGFQNTVKTAVLTLVLVAMLIVVLSSVDSGLWYLLTSILRKPA